MATAVAPGMPGQASPAPKFVSNCVQFRGYSSATLASYRFEVPGRQLEVEQRFILILNKESGSPKSLKGRTAVKKSYHTINKQGKANRHKRAEWLSRNGQICCPWSIWSSSAHPPATS